jgi:hypothetical protein
MRLNHHRGKDALALGLILLFFVFNSLAALDMSGEFAVTYQEYFDTTIYDASYFHIQSTDYPVACRVGTLCVTRTGTNYEMYGLRLARSGHWSNGTEYFLDSSKRINNQKKFGAQLVARITCGNKAPQVRVINWSSGQDPLVDLNHLLEPTDFPIIVDFYLGMRNINNAQQALGARLQFQGVGGQNLGDFRIVSRRKNPDNSWEYFDEFLPNTAVTPEQPFYTINYNDKSEYYINGIAENQQIVANLSIEEILPEGRFDLHDAIENNSPVQIGQARVIISGSGASDDYGVYLKFLDGNGSTDNSFLLEHEDVGSRIPFSLYLGEQSVRNNENIEWGDLQFGDQNIKTLSVGNILLSDVEDKVAGFYSDTITVQITPMDTNLLIQ